MINNGAAARKPRRATRCRVALAFGAGLLVACERQPPPPAEELYQGTAELDERTLAFEATGRIVGLEAHEGDRVKAGAVLATIDLGVDERARQARELEARAASAEATVVDKGTRPEQIAVTKARLRAALAAEELAKKTLARERELFARNVTPEARIDELDAEYATRVAERESIENQLREQQRGARPEERAAARAKAEAAQANVALDDLRIEKRQLLAPADAVVLDVHLKAGELATAGAPVMTVADPASLYAYVFVPQQKLSGIDVGDRASVRADGVGKALSGHVETIARRTEFTPRYLFSESERQNLVVRVKVRIADPEQLLHAGVPLRVSIERNTPPSARTLEPEAAVAPSASPSAGTSAAASTRPAAPPPRDASAARALAVGTGAP